MQLSNHVTLPKNTPHNRDYVDCSPIPGNGIVGKSGADPRAPSPAEPPTCCACFSRIESQRAVDDSIRTLRTADRFQPQALGRTAGRSRAGSLTAPDRDRSARSSLWEISKRWCKPLSMPQCSRFRRNQLVASSREGSRLVISATSSSLRPSVWRNSRAACSANGKPTCSPVTGAVQILRLSWRFLLICCTRALVGVDSRGKKIALRSGDECFDLFSYGGLVALDREQIIGPVFQDQGTGGFILGV